MSAAPAHALQQAFQTLTSGDADAAEAQLRAILKQYPEDPDAGFLLGTLLLNLKRAADAIPYLNLAKDARANDPVFRFNMAEALMRTGEDAAAEPHLRALLKLNPNDPGHHHKLGLCLSRQGRDGEAESLFKQVTRHPDAPGDWFNDLGLCLQELGRAAEAESAYREAVARLPDQARPIYNLGNMLLDQHRPAEAVTAYDQAIRLSPDLAMAHLHKAYALLMQGDYAAAWPEYEWRWRAGYNLSNWRDFDCPLWDGGPLEGRTLALYAEQGMGDTIQFSRFIAPLMARHPDSSVLLQTQPPLARFLSTLKTPRPVRVVPWGDPLPAYDLRLPLLSLPERLGVELGDAGIEGPYAEATPDAVERFRDRLAASGKPIKAGLAWAAFAERRGSARRTCAFEHLLPLFELEHVQWVNLQKDVDEAAPPFPPSFLDLMGDVGDFADSAGIVASLDVVISIDTAAVHMAGALGIPCWVMVPKAGDWRWLLARDDSPWYPQARLFRQSENGRWDDVVARVKDALKTWPSGPEGQKNLPQ